MRERERERESHLQHREREFSRLVYAETFFRLVYVSVTIVFVRRERGGDRTEVFHSVIAQVARASFNLARVSRVSCRG